MNTKLAQIQQTFEEHLALAQQAKDVETLRTQYLGKKGPIQQLMQELKEQPPEQKPLIGKLINELKQNIQEALDQVFARLSTAEKSERLQQESIDVTLPARRGFCAGFHPITKMLDEVLDVLMSMGFSVQEGPHIESDYYNFQALNFAEDHPARDMQDTFYLSKQMLLRTHTSNVQVRTMQQHAPPIRIISMGKCFRNEDVSARSHVVFHQVEALYISKGVSFADLVSTFEIFLEKLFQQKIPILVRPSYFPFVEPGLEVDMQCLLCKGCGCTVCKKTGWLEIAGAGMVHPQVLKNGGIDPEVYTGFAWGMGIERLVMIRHGIKDIRLFMENDYRFLRQFIHA